MLPRRRHHRHNNNNNDNPNNNKRARLLNQRKKRRILHPNINSLHFDLDFHIWHAVSLSLSLSVSIVHFYSTWEAGKKMLHISNMLTKMMEWISEFKWDIVGWNWQHTLGFGYRWFLSVPLSLSHSWPMQTCPYPIYMYEYNHSVEFDGNTCDDRRVIYLVLQPFRGIFFSLYSFLELVPMQTTHRTG